MTKEKTNMTFDPLEKIKLLKNGSLMVFMDSKKWVMFTKQEVKKIKEVLSK